MRHNFRESRQLRGLTLATVGKDVGSSKQMICDIEHGRRSPSWSLQQRLVMLFGIPAETLLAITEDHISKTMT